MQTPAMGPSRPSTATVIGLLALVALIFSYLIGYALTNALVAAEVIARWPVDHDPRPRNFIICFVGLMGLFVGFGSLARSATRRQLRRLAAMEEEAEAPLT